MSKLIFKLDEAAEIEFYDIVDYYKKFDPLLSNDFILEFENAIQRLSKFPKAGHPYLHQTKRIFLNRFPYSIVYKIYRDELIIIFAVKHLKQKPSYWEKRLK